MTSSKPVHYIEIVAAIIILIAGCRNQPTNSEDQVEGVEFLTDRNTYFESDTIRILLRNDSQSDLTIGLRCGFFLEMTYQIKSANQWGDNLWLPYMYLDCPTFLDTITVNTKFSQSLSADVFDSTGTFRLLLDVYFPQSYTSMTVISNTFEID